MSTVLTDFVRLRRQNVSKDFLCWVSKIFFLTPGVQQLPNFRSPTFDHLRCLKRNSNEMRDISISWQYSILLLEQRKFFLGWMPCTQSIKRPVNYFSIYKHISIAFNFLLSSSFLFLPTAKLLFASSSSPFRFDNFFFAYHENRDGKKNVMFPRQ